MIAKLDREKKLQADAERGVRRRPVRFRALCGTSVLLQERGQIVTSGSLRRVPGYGIPLHSADPRAPAVLKVANAQGTAGVYARIGMYVEDALAAARGGKRVPMNLDGVSAVVVLDLGFDWRSTRLFLLTPRSVSMGAHYLEELEQNSTWRHIPADQIEYL